MGKKGKKSGKKKGGKKKKAAEPEITWQEALLAYKISIKEKQMEDVQYELRALQEKNKRHKERNERLKAEQVIHMKNLLKQNQDFQKKLDSERVIEKEEVVEIMKDKWDAGRQEEADLQELRQQIKLVESYIVSEKKQVEKWTEYKGKGQHDHSKQIDLLKKELDDMQVTFDEMKAHLERDLDTAKTEIQTKTDEKLDKQKHLATEKAMARMDKYSRQEVLDNDWLRREVEIHKEESATLMSMVDKLEKENLAVMSELFECHVDDLKISRNFYLTQFAEEENLDETGILEMDLSKLSLQLLEQGQGQEADGEHPPSRPKSAVLKYVEDKVLSLPSQPRADDEESDYDGDNDIEGSDEEDPFSNYFHFDDEDFDDYLKLGPLELKLLNITGQKVPLHRPRSPPKEEVRARQFKPSDWPVSKPAAQKAGKVK